MNLSFHERGFKSDYNELESLIYFVLTRYLSFDILYEIRLRIILKKTADDPGSCYYLGSLPYRRFDLEIRKDNIYLNLIHELIHVKQVLLNQHVVTALGRELWFGRDYSFCEYDLKPWEIEAGNLEKYFYDEWINKKLKAS